MRSDLFLLARTAGPFRLQSVSLTWYHTSTDGFIFPEDTVSSSSDTKGVKELESPNELKPEELKTKKPLQTEANKAAPMAPGNQVRFAVVDLSFYIECETQRSFIQFVACPAAVHC